MGSLPDVDERTLMLWFIVGFCTGGTLGILTAALLFAARQEEPNISDRLRIYENTGTDNTWTE